MNEMKGTIKKNFFRLGLLSAASVLLLSVSALAKDEFSPDSIISLMKRVANFRCHSTLNNNWPEGTYFAGIMALYQRTGDKRYLDTAIAWGQRYKWKPNGSDTNTTVGDQQCCFQTYCEIYLLDSLAANRYMVLPANNNITHMFDVAPLPSRRWGWIDLMFMAPPGIVRLAQAMHTPRFVDSMNVYWWNSSATYFDTVDHLFYRDTSFVTAMRLTGKKTFWSRGNGWVFGGLSRVLPYLPPSYPPKTKFETQFKEMAEKLKSVQAADGLWRSDLLRPDTFPEPETSGSAFFCFGLAWGINSGLLDRTAYEPAVRKAWSALVGKIRTNGSLGWVQPPGDRPAASVDTNTQPYAEGAFLMAGNELYKLVTTTPVERSAMTLPATRQYAPNCLLIETSGGSALRVPQGATRYTAYTVQGRKILSRSIDASYGSKTITVSFEWLYGDAMFIRFEGGK